MLVVPIGLRNAVVAPSSLEVLLLCAVPPKWTSIVVKGIRNNDPLSFSGVVDSPRTFNY